MIPGEMLNRCLATCIRSIVARESFQEYSDNGDYFSSIPNIT